MGSLRGKKIDHEKLKENMEEKRKELLGIKEVEKTFTEKLLEKIKEKLGV